MMPCVTHPRDTSYTMHGTSWYVKLWYDMQWHEVVLRLYAAV